MISCGRLGSMVWTVERIEVYGSGWDGMMNTGYIKEG